MVKRIKNAPALSLESLRPAPYNPRTITDQAKAALQVSIERFGDISGIVWNRRSGNIIAGHQRLDVLRKAHGEALDLIDGAIHTPSGERFPVRVVDWDDQTELAANIAANSPSMQGAFTPDVMGLLDTIRGFDPIQFDALRFDELTNSLKLSLGVPLPAGNTDPDEIPAPPKKATTKPGDLWLMGDHRLLCGDSTRKEDVTRVMGGEKAALFQTDPPYVVNYDGTNHPQSKSNRPEVANKDWSDTYHEQEIDGDGAEFYRSFCRASAEFLMPEAAWYCWHASKRQAMLEAIWGEFGVFVHQQIIWKKSRPVLTYSAYMWVHEPCLMGWVKGNKPNMKKDYEAGDWPRSVWEIPNSEIDSDEHPTSKPVRLFSIPIEMHTQPGDICFEPFSGSGSQFIAAEQLGRRCYGIEISPVYCDVIVARWENFTGRKACRG